VIQAFSVLVTATLLPCLGTDVRELTQVTDASSPSGVVVDAENLSPAFLLVGVSKGHPVHKTTLKPLVKLFKGQRQPADPGLLGEKWPLKWCLCVCVSVHVWLSLQCRIYRCFGCVGSTFNSCVPVYL